MRTATHARTTADITTSSSSSSSTSGKQHQQQHFTNSPSPRIPAEFIEMVIWVVGGGSRGGSDVVVLSCARHTDRVHVRKCAASEHSFRANVCHKATCSAFAVCPPNNTPDYSRIFRSTDYMRRHRGTRVPFMLNTQLNAPLITHKCVENPQSVQRGGLMMRPPATTFSFGQSRAEMGEEVTPDHIQYTIHHPGQIPTDSGRPSERANVLHGM